MRERGSKLLPHFKTSAPIVRGATLGSYGAKRNLDGLPRTRVRRTSMRRHILSRPTWRPPYGRAQQLCVLRYASIRTLSEPTLR
jgi:hypothetical protein